MLKISLSSIRRAEQSSNSVSVFENDWNQGSPVVSDMEYIRSWLQDLWSNIAPTSSETCLLCQILNCCHLLILPSRFPWSIWLVGVLTLPVTHVTFFHGCDTSVWRLIAMIASSASPMRLKLSKSGTGKYIILLTSLVLINIKHIGQFQKATINAYHLMHCIATAKLIAFLDLGAYVFPNQLTRISWRHLFLWSLLDSMLASGSQHVLLSSASIGVSSVWMLCKLFPTYHAISLFRKAVLEAWIAGQDLSTER